MKQIKHIAFIILSAGIFSSCEREYYKPITISQNDSISFNNDILPVLKTNCAKSGCHNAGSKVKGLNFEETDAYITITDNILVDTLNPESSLLYTKIHSGSMKSYSTPEFTAKVLLWIKQGAQEN